MNYWRLCGDIDNFASILPVRMSDLDSLWMRDAIPRIANWSPCDMRIVTEDGLPLPDLSNIVSASPIAASNSIEVLLPLFRDAVELLPLPAPAEDFKILHVMDIVDCLDHDASKVLRFSVGGGVSAILHYAFESDKLRGKHIFKIPEMAGLEVFVSDVFRETVERHRLRGAIFRPIP